MYKNAQIMKGGRKKRTQTKQKMAQLQIYYLHIF